MVQRNNAIVVVNIGKDNLFQICKKSIENYCTKYDLGLEVIKKKKYNIQGNDLNYNYLIFEKNQVFDLYEKYKRILRLDVDLIISPKCPNLFDLVPEDTIGVVFEDVGPKEYDRRNQIMEIQEELGNIDWKTGYFNSGVVLASKKHKNIFRIDKEEKNLIKNFKFKLAKEQTFLNYRIRSLGFKLFELEYKFNHITKIFSGDWIGNPDRFKSYIIHYAGNQKIKAKMMKSDTKKFKRIYKKN